MIRSPAERRLSTARLDLWTHRECDTAFLHDLFGEAARPKGDVRVINDRCEVVTGKRFELIYTPQFINGWVGRAESGEQTHGFAFWLATERVTGQPIGVYGLIGQSDDGPPLLGWYTHRASRRRGFAVEAVRELIRWAFRELSLDRVRAVVLPENTPSQAVAIAAGMRRMPGQVEHAGVPHLAYEVTRDVRAKRCRDAR